MKKNIAVLTSVIILGASAGVSLFADADPTIPTASPVSVSTAQDAAITITLPGASNDGGSITFATTTSPAHGTLGAIAGAEVLYTPESGFTGSDSFAFVAFEGATSSAPATVSITITAPAPATGTAHITVRDGAIVATSTIITFPLSGTTSIATTGGDTHEASAASVLSALIALDASSSEFAISDLQYNSGFGAFYLRCIALAAAPAGAECDNWQYTVNGTGPAAGMDQYDLHDGDTVYVYYGYPRIVALSATTTTAGTPVTATAKQYDPATGTYGPTAGYTIGATQPNPADPWNPLEIATSTVDSGGQAIFTLSATGTYAFGLREDYYFPTTPLQVTDTATDTSGSSGGSGGFSGGSDPYAATVFNIPSALAFLAAQQDADGSFANSLVTDWAALAFSNYPGAARDTLRSYLAGATPALSNVTDHERHAMALLALGISPYDGTARDHIAPILASFDGAQIGDSALITDDIFALFPLLHAGYTQTDALIRAIATHIIAKQRPDGSWEESPDVTAAAMQALGPLYTIPGYGAALGKAAGYLATTQRADGGWENIDSTSWVQTMVSSVKEADPARAPVFVSSSGKKPEDALLAAQQSDGGVRGASEPVSTRAWSTAYAIVAASGKSWVSLLQNFAKPTGASSFSGGSDPYATTTSAAVATSTTLSATSTLPLATTTPAIASSTPQEATSTALSMPAPATTTASAPSPKKLARTPSVHAPRPSPTPTQVVSLGTTTLQVAAAADARPSLFSRIARWFRHVLGW